MGNIQTIETRHRKPIFNHNNRPFKKHYTPPPIHSSKNRVYIHPHDYKNVLKSNSQYDPCSPFHGSRYKYSQNSFTPETKKNSIYRNLEKKLSKKQVGRYKNINNLSKSYCAQPRVYQKYNYSNSFRENYPSFHEHSTDTKKMYPGEYTQLYDNHYIKQHQHDSKSMSFFESFNSPLIERNINGPIPQYHRVIDDLPTERKVPAWYNQSLGASSLEIHEQNRIKCTQIMKKVRNFNDFLNQIKKKIKSQQQNSIKYAYTEHSKHESRQKSQNITWDQQPDSYNYSSKQKQSKEISLMFKLQNQKMQLQKYRKMIERELSKQHSISSISIEDRTGNKKQKIIKIQYDSVSSKKQSESDQNKQKESLSKTKVLSFDQQNNRKNRDEDTVSRNRMVNKFDEVSEKLKELGALLKEKKGDDHTNIKQRVENINYLMKHLQEVNYQAQVKDIRQHFQKIAPDFMQTPQKPTSKPLFNLKPFYESDDDI